MKSLCTKNTRQDKNWESMEDDPAVRAAAVLLQQLTEEETKENANPPDVSWPDN